MNKPKDPEAAETVQTTNVPAVDLPQLVRQDEPIGARSNESFRRLYEMSQSPQMEWSRTTKEPFYYHSKYCSCKNGYDCGHDCSGSYGFHVAEDAADIRRAGWKPNDQAVQPRERK